MKKDGMDGIFQSTSYLIPLGTGLARTTQPVGTLGVRLGRLSMGELEDDSSGSRELGDSPDRFSSAKALSLGPCPS